MCKGFCCEACETAEFEMKDDHGIFVCKLKKSSRGFCKAMCSTADNF